MDELIEYTLTLNGMVVGKLDLPPVFDVENYKDDIYNTCKKHSINIDSIRSLIVVPSKLVNIITEE